MPDLSQVEETLTRLGFTEHPDHPAAASDRVQALSHNGPYVVHGSWQRDDTIVHVEQNTAPDEVEADGSSVLRTYPPVLVVENTATHGRVAVSFGDLEAFERILAGDHDFNQNGDSAQK